MKDEEILKISYGNGKTLTLNMEQYDAVATLVRARDKRQYAANMLENVLSERNKEHIMNYICGNDELLSDLGAKLEDVISSTIEEQGYGIADTFMKELRLGRYKVTSNTGTECECEDTVLLTEDMAEILSFGKFGYEIISVDEDSILDPQYIDKVEFMELCEL